MTIDNKTELRKSLAGTQEKWFQLGKCDYYELDVIIARRQFGLDEYRAKYYLQWTWENQKRVALSHILNQNNVKICDVGCGIGTFHKYFFLNGKNNSLTGVDIAPSGLKLAKQLNNVFNCKYVLGDANNLPLPNDQYDYTFSLQLWQTLDKPEKLLTEMLRITKPNGTIAITTTNFFQDLLWQPRALLSFIFKKRYPLNSEKKIKEIIESMGLYATVDYITFRPKQSALKYLPKSVFHFVLSQCTNIDYLLHRINLEKFCTLIVIRFGAKNYQEKHHMNEHKIWFQIPITLFVFICLIIFHWYIDIHRWVFRRLIKE